MNFLAMKAPENTEEDSDDPEPGGEGGIKTKYSLY
jgi:hypothetical protein